MTAFSLADDETYVALLTGVVAVGWMWPMWNTPVPFVAVVGFFSVVYLGFDYSIHHGDTGDQEDALKHGYYLGFAVVGVSLLAIGVHQAAKCAGKTAGLTFCGVAFVVNGMSNWVFFVHVSSVVYTAGAQLLTRNPLWVVVSCFIALAVAIVAYAYRWRIYFVFAFFSVQTTYFGVVAVRYQRDQRSDLTQLGTTDWRWMAIAGAVLLLRVLYVWACNDTVERYLNSHCCCCCREGRHSDRNRTHGRASASGAKSNAKYAVVPEIEMY